MDDKRVSLEILQLLRKHNLRATEERFLQEIAQSYHATGADDFSSSIILPFTNSEDVSDYERDYTDLEEFTEGALETYKHEIALVLWPVFVYLYIDLLARNAHEEALRFFTKFSVHQDTYRAIDLISLSAVRTRDYLLESEFVKLFRSHKYKVRISREAYHALVRHLQENDRSLILKIINGQLDMDVYEGMPRTLKEVSSRVGALCGEIQVSSTKVFYSVVPDQDLVTAALADQEEEEVGEDGKPKKKKAKKDSSSGKKGKQTSNPFTPPPNRIPIPDLREYEKESRMHAIKEISKKRTLSSSQLPSICFYSFLNAPEGLNCVSFRDDSNVAAVGFADSSIILWSLTSSHRLKSLKSHVELDQLEFDSSDVMNHLIDDNSQQEKRLLHGHGGPVYSTSFSPDRFLLLSASADGTARLWDLHTYSNLVAYKGHNSPVWDVDFSPSGYYFATASRDRTARLWATDNPQPLRIFSGHLSDVECVKFHPNGNYVATGSLDRSCQLWDLVSGSAVRVFTGHKGIITSLEFSVDGRFLVCGGTDQCVYVWDIASGALMAQLGGHKGNILSICFSREGEMLATGCSGGLIKLWEPKKWIEASLEEVGGEFGVVDEAACLIKSYPTKATPIHRVHFTHRNLLLGAGPYQG
ncbi:transcription initiation factor TFIID subunit 5-like isoform X2 [Oscarella lobularis]|uniref:transcription initiation factor TFIID subunit 5-like isoform X2 n=1 Tax=Oscarella lobularis TaxID=121494 RepID=UPI003313515D